MREVRRHALFGDFFDQQLPVLRAIGNQADVGAAALVARAGITSTTRSALVPDWPALAEAMPGFDITAWFAMVGPASMPRDVTDKLNGAVSQALMTQDVKDRLAGIGLQPMPLKPEQLKAFMGSEVAKWVRLVKEANVQPE